MNQGTADSKTTILPFWNQTTTVIREVGAITFAAAGRAFFPSAAQKLGDEPQNWFRGALGDLLHLEKPHRRAEPTTTHSWRAARSEHRSPVVRN